MTILALQQALNAAGQPCALDGQLGPATHAALLSHAARRPLGQFGLALGEAIVAAFPAAGITTDLRLIHWTAQACHETQGFRFLAEQGGPDYCAQYDGRLGNDRPGDGYLYRGRGVFMLTGRANYARYGALIGEPLEDNPGLAAQPGIAVRAACAFWRERACDAPADADDCAAVTRRINGGLNGLADRQAITDRLKAVFGI